MTRSDSLGFMCISVKSRTSTVCKTMLTDETKQPWLSKKVKQTKLTNSTATGSSTANKSSSKKDLGRRRKQQERRRKPAKAKGDAEPSAAKAAKIGKGGKGKGKPNAYKGGRPPVEKGDTGKKLSSKKGSGRRRKKGKRSVLLGDWRKDDAEGARKTKGRHKEEKWKAKEEKKSSDKIRKKATKANQCHAACQIPLAGVKDPVQLLMHPMLKEIHCQRNEITDEERCVVNKALPCMRNVTGEGLKHKSTNCKAKNDTKIAFIAF